MKARKKLPPHKRPLPRSEVNRYTAWIGRDLEYPFTLAQSIDTVLSKQSEAAQSSHGATSDLGPQLHLLACSTRVLVRELRTVRDMLAVLNETNERGQS